MNIVKPKATLIALALVSLGFTAQAAAPTTAAAAPAMEAKAGEHGGIDTLGAIRKRGKLVVGNKMKFATFNVRNASSGRNEGYMADIARALAKRLLGDEAKLEFRETSDETRFELMARGEVDVLIDLTPSSAEKEKFVDFSEEIFRSGSALLVKKGSAITGVNSIRKGTRVIYVRDNTDIALLKMKAPKATYIEFENSADAFAALKAGQGDVFTQVITHLFRAAAQDPGYTVLGRFTDKPYYVAVREGDLAMRDAVDEALRAMKASGEYDALYQKWFAALGGNAPGVAQPQVAVAGL